MHPRLQHDLAATSLDRRRIDAGLVGHLILRQHPAESKRLSRPTEPASLQGRGRVEHRVGVDRNEPALERHAEEDHVEETIVPELGPHPRPDVDHEIVRGAARLGRDLVQRSKGTASLLAFRAVMPTRSATIAVRPAVHTRRSGSTPRARTVSRGSTPSTRSASPKGIWGTSESETPVRTGRVKSTWLHAVSTPVDRPGPVRTRASKPIARAAETSIEAAAPGATPRTPATCARHRPCPR